VVQLCCNLVIWINLKAGLSRNTTNLVLRALQLIISTLLHLIQLALLAQGITAQLPPITLPRDIRTAYQHYSQEPQILRTPCCPKCYKLYPDLESTPEVTICTGKVSRNSRLRCKEPLWRTQRLGKIRKMVPKMYFNTQKLEPWLKWFLSRKPINDHLEETFRKPAPDPMDRMHDVQDSP